MIKKTAKQKLYEDWLNEEKTMIITESEFEVKKLLQAAPHTMRVFYDESINKYMVCDGYNHLHQDMILAALDNYYYPFKNGFLSRGYTKVTNSPRTLFMSYVPKNAPEAQDPTELVKNEAADTYKKQYEYENGYMFSEEVGKHMKFTECGLYSALGKCLSVTDITEFTPIVQLD